MQFYPDNNHDKIFPAGKKIICIMKGVNGFVKDYYTPAVDMKGLKVLHELIKIHGANRFKKIELN